MRGFEDTSHILPLRSQRRPSSSCSSKNRSRFVSPSSSSSSDDSESYTPNAKQLQFELSRLAAESRETKSQSECKEGEIGELRLKREVEKVGGESERVRRRGGRKVRLIGKSLRLIRVRLKGKGKENRLAFAKLLEFVLDFFSFGFCCRTYSACLSLVISTTRLSMYSNNRKLRTWWIRVLIIVGFPPLHSNDFSQGWLLKH